MEKLGMSKLKEILRLRHECNLSASQISRALNISHTVVNNYLSKATVCDKNYDELKDLSYNEIISNLFPSLEKKYKFNPPNFAYINKELRRKGVTLELLHEEYATSNPNGYYGYTWFCNEYKKYSKKVNISMRQVHVAGEKLFIDFSGMTMNVVDKESGEINKVQIFVAVLGASDYPFVKAIATQSKKDFINVHVDMFKYFGGVPNILVPDNLKAAVISNKKGIVKLNDAYADMARHYGIAIEPARPYKPQDKSKVELGVKAIQRWILMRLRHHTFFNVDQLNEEINKLLDFYNLKKVRRFNKSRTELFELLDKPYLHPLRANRYVYKEFKKATVGIDYHVELLGNGYSVPYLYLGKKVDITYSSTSVVISLDGNAIAHHKRLYQAYTDSTMKEHMPLEHQYQYEKWNSRRILNWANSIGKNTSLLMQQIMDSKGHEVRAYKSCIAILSFSNTYGKEEIEKVSKVALEANILKVSLIEAMLKTKSYLYYYTQEKSVNNSYLNDHENIRGGLYYAKSDI